MKNRIANPVIPDYAPKGKKPEEPVLLFSPCLQCQKKIDAGYYGRFGNGGVCSRICNTAYKEAQSDAQF